MERQRAQASALGKDIDRLRSERDRANFKLAQLGHSKLNGSFSSPAVNRSPQPNNAEAGPSASWRMTSNASGIGLGLQEGIITNKQRLASDSASSSQLATSITNDTSGPAGETLVQPPALLRHQSDSGAEELERQAADEYRRTQTQARPAAPSANYTPGPANNADSPARPPRSGSRDTAQAGKMPQSALPPPLLALPAVPEQSAQPARSDAATEEPAKTSLLPSPTINDDQAVRLSANPSESRISFDPDIKQYLAAMATPLQEEFPAAPVSAQPTDKRMEEGQLSSPSHQRSRKSQALAPSASDRSDSAAIKQPELPSEASDAYKRDGPSPGSLSDLMFRSAPGRPNVAEVGTELTAANDVARTTIPPSASFEPSRDSQRPPTEASAADSSTAQQTYPVVRHDQQRIPEPHRTPAGHEAPAVRPAQTTRTATPPVLRARLDLPPNGFSPQYLPYTRVAVSASRIAPNATGKDVLFFISQVQCKAPRSNDIYTWNVAKLFSAFLALDNEIRSVVGGRKEAKAIGLVPLPDGKTWKDFAPSKIDQRKAALEAYLQSLLSAPIADKNSIARFLSTNIVDQEAPTAEPTERPGVKSGYLTKRGKAFGGCVPARSLSSS